MASFDATGDINRIIQIIRNEPKLFDEKKLKGKASLGKVRRGFKKDS